MANLSITTECNRQCSYCFARSAFKHQISKVPYMSLETFQRALDFLERSDIDQARLLGGEPTLHPEFPDLVEYVLDRKLRLLVFSNGFMPETAVRCLEKTPIDRTAILINITDNPLLGGVGVGNPLVPEKPHPEEHTRQIMVFQRLGSRVLLGLNIYTPAQPFDFMLDLIERYSLARTIRLGLAHPCVSGDNHFLPPQYYPTIGRRISEFATQARKIGVNVEFDCGFVPCMFSLEGLETLGKTAEETGQRCNPILDILPDGQVVSCYPLAHLHCEPLPDDRDASWLRSQFEQRLKPYRSVGIFRECSSCSLRENGMCLGGCLAAAMQRLRCAPFTFIIPQDKMSGTFKMSGTASSLCHAMSLRGSEATKQSCGDDRREHGNSTRLLRSAPFDETQDRRDDTKWIIPYIDQPLSFWEQLAGNYSHKIKEVYLPLPGEIFGSGRPPQSTEHLDQFLRRSLFPLSVLANPIILPRPVDELAPQIIEVLKKLTGEFGVGSVTVSDLLLAQHIRESLPELSLTASVLMDIAQPNQVVMMQNVCDTLVPASRIMRNLPALKSLREAFSGKIRLIVNEACLPNCPFRVQHFSEMGSNIGHPHSLCNKLLRDFPWMRLTGAWVLPQHLHLYNEIYDELKLAGRVTLRDPALYHKVLDAYLHRKPLTPNEIGGGPASVLEPIEITEEFFAQTLHCGHQCHSCTVCQEYWRENIGDFS
jgi:hypothetical protein